MAQKCVNGRFDDNQPHDFDVPMDNTGLMYCRQCGEVRGLTEAGDRRSSDHQASSDDLRQIAENLKAYRRERGYIK